jgi:iron(III) transport system ATP-binding protein
MVGLLKQLGTSVLFVTHDPEEALYMSDRVAVMRDGAILQVAAPETLYFAPASRFVASFFGHINVIPARVTDGRAETPFGAVDAKGLSGEVDVLVRAQGLVVSKGGDHALVRSARILGSSILLELETASSTGIATVLTARTAVGSHPQAGERVALALDPRLSFVFVR